MNLTRWSDALLYAVMLILVSQLPGGTGGYAQQAAPFSSPLTVDEAVTCALQHNPVVTNAIQNVQVSQEQVEAARASGLPFANATINTIYTPLPQTTTFQGVTFQNVSVLTSNVQLTVSKPVWPFTIWRAPVASACAVVGINEQGLVRTRQQVAFQTRQAFYQVFSSRELVQVAQESVAVARRQLELAENTVNAGLAAPLDVFQAKAVLANAEVTLVQTQNTLEVAHAVLATQLGVPADTPIQVVAPGYFPDAPRDVDTLVAEALRDRPELQQLNYQRQQICAGIALIRLQTSPLLNVQAIYSTGLVGGTLFSPTGLSFGAVISWDFFDAGRTRAEVKAAEIQLAQVDTRARQIELNITLEVRQAWLNLVNAAQQLTAAEEGRIAAAEALRIAQVRYENGEGIVLEVEQARLKLTQALTALAQARYQAFNASAQLAFAIGTPV